VSSTSSKESAVVVDSVSKRFRLYHERNQSLKAALMRGRRAKYDEFWALQDVDLQVEAGKTFGLIGHNGSGKSTLLKLLASIYRADAGRILMAGRLAPFIELGVGFNAELSARENVLLNGVMMGLTPKETRNRLDAVIEFAELTEFVDLKLKNYSSGMLVRLAFSVMLQADADILLIDEVLAVGDAAFQQKCDDAFREMKAAGKTIVLVTHDMATVSEYCNRAMLIEGGTIRHIGDPGEVGRRYLRLNFERGSETSDGSVSTNTDQVRIVDAWMEDTEGERARAVEHGQPIRLRLEIEALRDVPEPTIGFLVANADGVGVFQFNAYAETEQATIRGLSAGERMHVSADLANPLNAGRYHVHCGINQAQSARVLLYVNNAIEFVVFGGGSGGGIVELEHDWRGEGGQR